MLFVWYSWGDFVKLEPSSAGLLSVLSAGARSPEFSGLRDTTHVWGEYIETVLDGATLLREIIVYPGGRTSVHRHLAHSELNVVVGGAVRLFIGARPDELTEHVRRPGDLIHVPAGMYHAVAFESAEDRSAKPCARFFEVVYSHESAADIERAVPAVPGDRPGDPSSAFSGWIGFE